MQSHYEETCTIDVVELHYGVVGCVEMKDDAKLGKVADWIRDHDDMPGVRSE